MDGFLNIYKEKGPSSYDVIRKLKKIFKTSRIGHAGNLDPLGEGVLVVGIGKGTRFLEYIMDENKEYL
ncbi:MAG: tRNA pseudouridine(55) synthase TruB, partial [candidate division WOR-3 bacterium]